MTQKKPNAVPGRPKQHDALVVLYCQITPEQKAWLDQQRPASYGQTIRELLDRAMSESASRTA